MTAIFTATEYEAIPAGLYPAQLISIEKQPSDSFGEFLKWTFRLRLANGNLTDLTAASSTSTGPKSKAYKWAAVLLGHTPTAGVAEDVTGKVCQLHVIVNEEGFNRIESLLPAAAVGTAPVLEPAPAAPAMDAPPAKIEAAAAPPSTEMPF